MNLHTLIIHKLEKRREQTTADLSLRDAPLETDELATDFIESVRDTYARKSALQYGSFRPNVDSYPFQGMMQDYLDHDETFTQFSRRASRHLQSKMETESMATGGYVVFSHFRDDETEYMLCLMVDDTEGFGIDEDLSLLERIHLDLEDLQIAGRVNVDDWRNDEPGHVSFIPGKKEVSQYFKSFFGVQESSSPTKATRKAKEAIDSYMQEHDYDEDERDEVNKEVANYMKRCINNDDAATIRMLFNIVDQDNPDRFREHAASDDYRVDSTFAPSRSVVNTIQRYEIKSDGIDIRFNKNLFRQRVSYDPDSGDLTVNNVSPEVLPDDLKREIGLDE